MQCSKTKLSKKNNLLKRKNKCPKSFNSKSLLITANGFKKNNTKKSHVIKSTSKKGLLLKNKSKKKSVVKKKNTSNQLGRHSKILGSKLIQNKLQHVMLKEELGIQMLNGNLSPEINKNVIITRKKSFLGSTEKDKTSSTNKVSSESVKLTNNKSNTTYVLRPKVSNSNKKMNEHVIKDTVLNNIDFESDITVLSDTSGNSKKIVSDFNDKNQAEINFIKTEPINEESNTKINYVNGGQKSAKCLEILYKSKEDCFKIKPVESKNTCNKEFFAHTDKNQLDR